MGCKGSKVADGDVEARRIDNEKLQTADKEPVNGAKIGDQLKNVPILARLSDEERATLGASMLPKTFENGKTVFKQGDTGDGFYVVHSGAASVRVKGADGKESEIGTLKVRDYFGETALLNEAPRGATVKAVGKLGVYFLKKAVFAELFNRQGKVQFAKRRIAVNEAEGAGGDTLVSKIDKKDRDHTKSKAVRNVILTAIRENVLFENLDEDACMKIVDAMYRVEMKIGDSPTIQGDPGDCFYVVEKGDFHCFIEDKKLNTKVKVAALGPGTGFGELALMYNAPRAATVTAVTPATVWVINRDAFRRIGRNIGESRLKAYTSFLTKVELLAPLSAHERTKVAEALEEVKLPNKHVIFKQGQTGDTMYIVRSGECQIFKDNKLVMTAKPGQYFGERALLMAEPRAATVTVTADSTVLLQLDRAAFSMLLGPLEDIMHKRAEGYNADDDNTEKAKAKKKNEEKKKKAQKPEQTNIKMKDLKIIGTLGKGSFGHVQLVQHKQTDTTYALKQVQKAQIVETGQQGHIISEKNVMVQLMHPFLIRLYQTYTDQNCLYFLLEVCMGGELFTILRKKHYFEDDVARFYAACVTMGFEYMHSLDIVYRDLKPENLLITDTGFLKITDFGFAKVLNGRTWTLCGTPDYLAPEIVNGLGHGKGVDWWTLGVLIYEMIASIPPFADDDPMTVYQKISSKDFIVAFPNYFPKDVVNLVKRLLQRKPTKRLGVVKGGAAVVKAHPWFTNAKTNWDDLYNMKAEAPIIPVVKSPMDLSNFEAYEGEDNTITPYKDDGTGWDKDF